MNSEAPLVSGNPEGNVRLGRRRLVSRGAKTSLGCLMADMTRVAFPIVLLGVSVVIADGSSYPGYELLWILPAMLAISYLLVIHPALRKNPSTFLVLFSSVVVARYGVLPLLIVLSNWYSGRSMLEPIADSYREATLLMAYELILCSIFVRVLFVDRKPDLQVHRSIDMGNLRTGVDTVFWLFGAGVTAALFIFPRWASEINLFRASVRASDTMDTSTLQLFVVYGVMLFKQLLFLRFAQYCLRRYQRTGGLSPIFASVVAGAVNIGIYVGTNRSDVLVVGIATAMVLYRLFGRAVVPHLIGLLAFVCAALIQATEARDLYVDKSKTQVESFTDILQVYLGGPYNVAIAVETKAFFPEAGSIPVLFMDIFRPMIGPNLFLKSVDVPYSNVFFNARIFIGTENRSQILPMIGQGNLHFGTVLAPLMTLVFVYLAYRLTRVLRKSSDPMIYYFLTLAVARLGFMMGQNSMNMINDISMNLFLFLILYWLNSLVSPKRDRRSSMVDVIKISSRSDNGR